MFTRRKPIISVPGIAKVIVPYESGMKADFADIRFLGSDETTVLDYTRSSYVASTSAEFLVDVADTNIFCYFGDPSLTYTSTWTPTPVLLKHISHEYGYVKDSGNPVIAPSGGAAWDSTFISAPVAIEVSGTTYMFYGGCQNITDSNRKPDVGLATSTDGINFTKQGIVINKSVLSADSAWGIAPFSIIEISGVYHLFVSVYFGTAGAIKAAYFTSTDLTNWTFGAYLTGIIASSHSPRVIEDPSDASNLILYYSDMTTGGTKHIRRAQGTKANPTAWTNDADCLTSASLYPFVWHDGNVFNMVFADGTGTGYKLRKASSVDGVTFSYSLLQPIVNGGSGAWDEFYCTMPYIFGDKLYYAGRQNAGDDYIGIGVAVLSATGGLQDWSSREGTVNVSTTAHSGTYGADLVGAATNPVLFATALGKNKTYEIWFNDDMSTGSNRALTFRPYGGGGSPHSNLIGLDTPHSTTKYVYRKKSGSWVVSSINRTSGWHKLSYEIDTAEVRAYIDGTLIYTDTVYDPDLLTHMAVYGYTAGTYSVDDFRIYGTSTNSVVLGTEVV